MSRDAEAWIAKLGLIPHAEGGHYRETYRSEGRVPQATKARCYPAERSFSLVGCTVSPGFEFADFVEGERSRLVGLYPRHRAIIEQLTR